MRSLVLLLCILGMQYSLFAHGVVYKITREKSVIVTVHYSDNEPVSYAGVKIFSPENRKVEYQNGRTDKNGRFAFFPHRDGNWEVRVDDGMGHGLKTEVSVDSLGNKDVESGTGHMSGFQKILVAAAIVWGFIGFFFFYRAKSYRQGGD